jgi:hypothetical protein
MKYSRYFGAKWRGFIKSISVLVPKGAVHLLNENNENIRYDISPFLRGCLFCESESKMGRECVYEK